MTFIQWLSLILAAFAAISTHRVGIMLLAHNLDVRYHAIREDSKPDILGQVAALLPMVHEIVSNSTKDTNAQENSEQGKVDGEKGGSPGA